MDYEMEELVPIVAELAEKYTAFESTSITYEKAEQLMEAVLYCIREAEQPEAMMVPAGACIRARQAYKMGVERVKEKVKKSLALYHKILPGFVWFENTCLYDSVVKGLPEFFRRYDILFEPQRTILTLDYPVLRDISESEGVDKIYEFIRCVYLEQEFLKIFPEGYVAGALRKYDREYRDMAENICEIVILNAGAHLLAGKPLSELDFDENDYRKLQNIFRKTETNDLSRKLENMIEKIVRKYCADCIDPIDLIEYLAAAVQNICVRLKNAAEYESLWRLF